MFSKKLIAAATFAAATVVAGFSSMEAQAASVPSGVWGVDVNVSTFKPTGSKTHTGAFLFDADALNGTGGQILKQGAGLVSSSFNWKGKTYTSNKAKAKFFDGELVGMTFAFKHEGKKFLIKLDDLLVNKKVSGAVNYDDTTYALALAAANEDNGGGDGEPVAVPTPAAFAGGLSLLAAAGLRRRTR